MAAGFLNLRESSAAYNRKSSEGMPERVRSDVLSNPCFLSAYPDNLPYAYIMNVGLNLPLKSTDSLIYEDGN